MCTIYEQKNLVCIQILRAYTGIGDAKAQSSGVCVHPIPGGMRKPNLGGDAESPSPGMLRKPGDLPQVCPRLKSLKGLPRATHCTDRAQTSGNMTLTVEFCPPHLTFRMKVRAQRGVSKKKNGNYTSTYTCYRHR